MNLKNLEGQWFINLTNFPMWLKGDKTSPSFNYTVEKRGKIIGLKDEVQYFKNGKISRIVGFDTPMNDENTTFLWRGKGILSLLTSRWEILYFDTANDWAIIYFEKTLFTPKGYDVISRVKILDNDFKLKINTKLMELEITDFLATLQHHKHE